MKYYIEKKYKFISMKLPNKNIINVLNSLSEFDKIKLIYSNNEVLRYITDKGTQFKAIRRQAYNIRFVKNPSEEMQLAAVAEDEYTIKYINNPTERVQLLATSRDAATVRYLDNPSEKVQLAVVESSPHCFSYIKKPTPKVKALYKKLI